MLQELATDRPTVRANGNSAHRSELSAHYDALLQRIQAAHLDTTLGQTIGVTSCASGAGVSTVAFNVAVAAARSGCGPVLYIDADINKRLGPNVLGDLPVLGLADAIVGAAVPLECVKQTQHDDLSVVSGCGVRSHCVASFDRNKFSELLNEYKRHFKLLVIDIPAPTELNGSVYLASQLDGVLLVIEAERADGRAALRTKQQLADANVNLLGVVLNKRRKHVPGWLYRRL